MSDASRHIRKHTVDILCQILESHPIDGHRLPDLIREIGEIVGNARDGSVHNNKASHYAHVDVPSAPISENFIICLECGRPFRTLGRHLISAHGMTAKEYKRKWKLSKRQALTARQYSRRRATIAKRQGLGRRPTT
ncbi:MAG: hypothetical protein CMO30_08815 [Tistrella sp.]|uniref:MucR family transcriptional regulator n=1 Tax=Tistrella sp. TaxID=2024861 RepID=UPI000C51C4AF|nr:hypothetical protein [Tistrella sp.]MBA75368.1 hypothetical protein [Tistrella sp.]